VVGIEHPGELAVLVGLGPLEDLDAGGAQPGEQLVEVVDAIVDHEARLARCEPLAVGSGCRPYGHTAVDLRVVGPIDNTSAPILEFEAEIVAIPRCEGVLILCAF